MFNLYFVARNKTAMIEGFKRGNKSNRPAKKKANNNLMTDIRNLRIFFTDKLSVKFIIGQNAFHSQISAQNMCEAT